MAEKTSIQKLKEVPSSRGARKKEMPNLHDNDKDMEKLKELEQLADIAFQKVFEDFMKNKDKKPAYQPTEDEIEMAKKNYFSEDEESLYETFNQPLNTVWGTRPGEASSLYEKNSTTSDSDLFKSPESSHIPATASPDQIQSSIEKMNLEDKIKNEL